MEEYNDLFYKLIDAIMCKNTEEVESLLKQGAPVNVDPEEHSEPIEKACEANSIEIAKLLLDAGASLDYIVPHGGWSPLHWAISNDNLDLIKLLFDYGLNIKTHGTACYFTPLQHAIYHKKFDAAKLLIQRGADVNAVGNSYPPPDTPLEMTSDSDLRKLLKEHGALGKLELLLLKKFGSSKLADIKKLNRTQNLILFMLQERPHDYQRIVDEASEICELLPGGITRKMGITKQDIDIELANLKQLGLIDSKGKDQTTIWFLAEN